MSKRDMIPSPSDDPSIPVMSGVQGGTWFPDAAKKPVALQLSTVVKVLAPVVLSFTRRVSRGSNAWKPGCRRICTFSSIPKRNDKDGVPP